jgi:hypothetical protein
MRGICFYDPVSSPQDWALEQFVTMLRTKMALPIRQKEEATMENSNEPKQRFANLHSLAVLQTLVGILLLGAGVMSLFIPDWRDFTQLALVAGLGLIISGQFILVLLAIEQNTRQTAEVALLCAEQIAGKREAIRS